jgi:homoserine kinase
MKTIKASAPATVANVSCGFDVLGFAVNSPVDVAEVTLTDHAGEVIIPAIYGDEGRLPKVADKNTAGVAVKAYLHHLNSTYGASVVLHKNLPLGSGMGSSAASAVAALVAINALHDHPLSKKELLPFALEAEQVACGAAHADNVAPCLLGGFVLIRDYNPLDVVEISAPPDLFCTLVHPHIELKTEDSRKILKQTVHLKDAITQWGNIAGLVTGLMKPDYDLISRSMKDVIAEPYRAMLIPGFYQVKSSAKEAGVLGCGISGSGPTVFCLSLTEDIARKAGEVMQAEFRNVDLQSDVYLSSINTVGAKLILD